MLVPVRHVEGVRRKKLAAGLNGPTQGPCKRGHSKREPDQTSWHPHPHVTYIFGTKRTQARIKWSELRSGSFLPALPCLDEYLWIAIGKKTEEASGIYRMDNTTYIHTFVAIFKVCQNKISRETEIFPQQNIRFQGVCQPDEGDNNSFFMFCFCQVLKQLGVFIKVFVCWNYLQNCQSSQRWLCINQ